MAKAAGEATGVGRVPAVLEVSKGSGTSVERDLSDDGNRLVIDPRHRGLTRAQIERLENEEKDFPPVSGGPDDPGSQFSSETHALPTPSPQTYTGQGASVGTLAVEVGATVNKRVDMTDIVFPEPAKSLERRPARKSRKVLKRTS